MTTPTVSNVSGTIATGQTLTITGTNMVNLNTTNWLAALTNNQGSFETAFAAADLPNADGWVMADGSPTQTRTSAIKLFDANSYLSHHAGAEAANHTSMFYNSSFAATSPPLYVGLYVRMDLSGGDGSYPDNYRKIIGFYGGTPANRAFVDWNGNAGSAFTQIKITNAVDGTAYGAIPGGVFLQNRWWWVEAKVPSGAPNNHQVWLNNSEVINVNWTVSPDGTAADLEFDINHCCTGAGYDCNNYMDGLVVSTARILPASVIEIGNNSDYATATKVYQFPELLSNTSNQCICDLTGLGAGPYWMWVTNNLNERSAAFSLSGGGQISKRRRIKAGSQSRWVTD